MSRYSDAFNNHIGKVSDKWSSYLPQYDQVVERVHPNAILEIGVQNGGSLEIWSSVYPDAEKIIGLDVDESCSDLKFESTQIQIVIADASQADSASAVQELVSNFDLIIDDGSHRSDHIVSSFIHFLPMLSPGGIYVIEDLHASYWPSWGGSLYRENSAMKFLYRVVDVINHEHWRSKQELEDYLQVPIEITKQFFDSLHRIKRISFTNSLAVIESGKNEHDSEIGNRVIAGNVAHVSDGMIELASLPMSGVESDEEFSDEQLDDVESVRARLEITIQDKEQLITKLESDCIKLAESTKLLSLQLEETQVELESTKSELEASNSIRREMESEITGLFDQAISMNDQLKNMAEATNAFERQISEMQKSKSWQLTMPLRKLKDLLKPKS